MAQYERRTVVGSLNHPNGTGDGELWEMDLIEKEGQFLVVLNWSGASFDSVPEVVVPVERSQLKDAPKSYGVEFVLQDPIVDPRLGLLEADAVWDLK